MTLKRTLAIACAIALSITSTAGAQGPTEQKGLKIGSTTVGGTITVGGRYTTIDGVASGILDVKAGIVLDQTWGIGFGFAAPYLDKRLTALVADGSYHMSTGYSGIYIERYFRFSDDFVASASVLMGQGVIMYQYDKEYRTQKAWRDEVIDQTTFAVFEPAISAQYRLGGSFWLGVTATIRNTSPVQLLGTSESIFRKGGVGMTARWDLF